MGSNSSKVEEQSDDRKKIESKVDAHSDPRSPTPEIVRTPLNNKQGTQHNITKNVDLSKTFENANNIEKLIHNNPILSAVIKNHLQSYDPRSPTQDFERTPIVISSKPVDVGNDSNFGSPCFLNDKNEAKDCFDSEKSCLDLPTPKNLCNEFLDMSLNDTLKDSDEPLGSSTASKEVIEDNISNVNSTQPTELLETNFEYVHSYSNNDENSIENTNKNNKTDIVDRQKQIPLYQILNIDPRSPSMGIERTPIVVPKGIEDLCEDNIEQLSDDVLIKTLQNTNCELRQTIKPQDKVSEGVLIYEDKTHEPIETPKKSKSDCSNGARTPLSCVKNKTDTGHARSKSVNTLHDPKYRNAIDKIPKRVSHIPRLKSLSNKTKHTSIGNPLSLKALTKTPTVNGDCENTPPQSHRDKWDKDNSIVL